MSSVPVAIFGLLLAASCAYYIAALTVLRRHPGPPSPLSKPAKPEHPPAISILKPAIGACPFFSEILDCNLDQDYPGHEETVVGVDRREQEVCDVVFMYMDWYPGKRIKIIDCPEPPPGCNPKVVALQRMAEYATQPVWVINDADISVPPDYLDHIAAELDKPNTGMVTCLYYAWASQSKAGKVEACRINTEFPAQVLLASALQGMRFGLGATLAIRAETLESVGGLESLRHVIGDDYHLGAKVAAQGLAVRLMDKPVTLHISEETTWRDSWRRQLRWARTIRKQRPLGHLCLGGTFAVAWSALALIVAPTTLWPLAVAAVAMRLRAAKECRRVLGATKVATPLWPVPIADLQAAAIWLWSYFGSRVWWRGRHLKLGPQGRIIA